jgi:hypothetical protein
VSKSRDR